MEELYGKRKLEIEKKQELTEGINYAYSKILSQLDEDFIGFVSSVYKTKESVVNNQEKIRRMYRAFQKPEKEVLLSAFALKVLDDSHGFDVGTSYRWLLKRMLIYLYNDDDLSNHNLYQDVISNSVYTRNVIHGSTNYYDIISLLDVPNVNIVSDSDIYMYENNGILDTLRQKYPDRKLISTQGHPNTATQKLIKRLIDNNNNLYYSGDLDLAGLKIADNLITEFPQIMLKDMDKETYYKYSDNAITSPKEQNIRSVKDNGLKEVFNIIKRTKKIINQEIII